MSGFNHIHVVGHACVNVCAPAPACVFVCARAFVSARVFARVCVCVELELLSMKEMIVIVDMLDGHS